MPNNFEIYKKHSNVTHYWVVPADAMEGDFGGLCRAAVTHVLANEPNAFRDLQEDSGITLQVNTARDYLRLVSALRSAKVSKKAKEKVERSIANFVVHGFEYKFATYSPAAAERDVLAATHGKTRSYLMSQWAENMAGWAEGHKKAYGSIIEIRKKKFLGIISEAVYKRINHLKTAHLSTFYKKMKNEAQEQLTYWSMLKIYPQYN